VDLLLRDPSKLRLGGEECVVTVLFTDLEGFTAMSERLAPEALRERLGEHFTEMVDALLAERATLDKFIGDSVMAYFGAPVADPEHAAHACRAALAMQRRMLALNARWGGAGHPLLRLRIGVNTGRVVAGNMGTATVFNYTVLGDTVNLASRLEGVNKVFRTGIIAGPDTRAQAGAGFVFRELDAIRVVGRAQPVGVHELVGLAGELAATRLAALGHYAEGLARYRARDWEGARRAFSAALALDGRDAPSLVMRERVAAYAEQPPPADWDGVHAIRAK
jgi:adenylate cyclase